MPYSTNKSNKKNAQLGIQFIFLNELHAKKISSYFQLNRLFCCHEPMSNHSPIAHKKHNRFRAKKMPTAHISFLTHLQYLTKSYHFHCDKKKIHKGWWWVEGEARAKEGEREKEVEGKKSPVPQAYIRELSPISEEKQERELPQRWCSKSQAFAAKLSCRLDWSTGLLFLMACCHEAAAMGSHLPHSL